MIWIKNIFPGNYIWMPFIVFFTKKNFSPLFISFDILAKFFLFVMSGLWSYFRKALLLNQKII